MKNYKAMLSLKIFNIKDINNLTYNEKLLKIKIQRMLNGKFNSIILIEYYNHIC